MTRPIAGRVSHEALHACCVAVLRAAGAAAEAAAIVADSLIDADLRGLDAHGVPARLPSYVVRMQAGGIQADGAITVVSDGGAVLALDANHTFGQVAAKRAIEVALDRAGAHGVGIVGVRSSNHLGALGYWTRIAAAQDMVGFALSGAAPRIAPWGAATPLLSTNPWSIAFPAGDRRPPLVVDVSNGAVLSGALVDASRSGQPIPFGWALDVEGRPTDDPAQALAGSMLPFGGAKGAALTLAFEVLGSVLTGGAYSRHVPDLEDVAQPQLLGQLFAALPADGFIPLEEFRRRADELLDWIESARVADGFVEVRVPGTRGEQVRKERMARGIPIGERLGELQDLAERFGLEPLAVQDDSDGD